MSWEPTSGVPTDNQIDHIKEMCEIANLDYEQHEPSTFDEASEMIDELQDSLGYEDYRMGETR